jgi:hypothetical protein
MSEHSPDRDPQLREALALPKGDQLAQLRAMHGDAPRSSADDRRAPIDLTAKIEYIHHTGPHHTDTPQRRAEKERTSALAREHEGLVQFEHGIPMEQWGADDIAVVIDAVRVNMPRVSPDGSYIAPPVDQADRFRTDGRALCHVYFGRIWRTKDSGLGVHIWFSTVAGYAATIYLPAAPPASAIVPFACQTSRVFDVRIDMNHRLARRLARELR